MHFYIARYSWIEFYYKDKSCICIYSISAGKSEEMKRNGAGIDYKYQQVLFISSQEPGFFLIQM